jgi:hypothetical protein
MKMNTNQTGIAKIKPKDIIEYKEVAVITTRQLADYYGTEINNVRNNFDRNQEWFVEGESYFKMEGEELKNWRKESSLRGVFSSGTGPVLYLWTEEGALLHAKMINTRPAWLIYKLLVANYFGAYTRRRNRESARKARENADWYKTRRIGVDDGRIPLTDTIEMFHTMYLRQKGEKGGDSFQPLGTFCQNLTRTGYVYAFLNYSYATKVKDLPDGVTLRDMFSQDELSTTLSST